MACTDQQANYQKSGFVLADETVRHSGVPVLPKAPAFPQRVIDLTADKLDALAVDYDARILSRPAHGLYPRMDVAARRKPAAAHSSRSERAPTPATPPSANAAKATKSARCLRKSEELAEAIDRHPSPPI